MAALSAVASECEGLLVFLGLCVVRGVCYLTLGLRPAGCCQGACPTGWLLFGCLFTRCLLCEMALAAGGWYPGLSPGRLLSEIVAFPCRHHGSELGSLCPGVMAHPAEPRRLAERRTVPSRVFQSSPTAPGRAAAEGSMFFTAARWMA